MSSNFFAMVERMKLIDRWALMNNTGKENIAEHSHTVAVIAHALALIGVTMLGGCMHSRENEIVTGSLKRVLL